MVEQLVELSASLLKAEGDKGAAANLSSKLTLALF
jgi:hypothetical protein